MLRSVGIALRKQSWYLTRLEAELFGRNRLAETISLAHPAPLGGEKSVLRLRFYRFRGQFEAQRTGHGGNSPNDRVVMSVRHVRDVGPVDFQAIHG